MMRNILEIFNMKLLKYPNAKRFCENRISDKNNKISHIILPTLSILSRLQLKRI